MKGQGNEGTQNGQKPSRLYSEVHCFQLIYEHHTLDLQISRTQPLPYAIFKKEERKEEWGRSL